jgi:large subunit ribosomal protein L13
MRLFFRYVEGIVTEQDNMKKKSKEKSRKWYLVNAEGQILGRMATRVADILRGKNKPTFEPHADTGDFVVVINAEKVKLTGRKKEQKVYISKSEYQGGQKIVPIKKVMEKKPEMVIFHAVKGMLPKNKLSSAIIKKLKVYAGCEHPHAAQQPENLNLGVK